MNWIAENLAEALIIAGIALLVLEILVLGFTTFIFFFVGVAAIISGSLMYFGVIPDTFLSGMLATALLTALAAAGLWKPLRNMQADTGPTEATNDLIGHRFTLTEPVSAQEQPDYRFSGINWKLKSAEPIEAGKQVEVTHTDVGVLTIRAID